MMKQSVRYIRRLGVMVFVILGLFSCEKSNGQSNEFTNIDVKEAYKMISEDSSIVLIDVRTPGEYNGPLGHIKGAELKPVQQIEQWSSQLDSVKDKKILLVCHSGNRSGFASRYLQKKGFAHIYNIMGGMLAWNRAGLPVEKEAAGEKK